MSNIKPIDAVMWAVFSPTGALQTCSIANDETKAINQFQKNQYSPYYWVKYQTDGYTCQQVRVRIEPIKQE